MSEKILDLQTRKSSINKDVELAESKLDKKQLELTSHEDESETLQSAISGAKNKYNEMKLEFSSLNSQIDKKIEGNKELQS